MLDFPRIKYWQTISQWVIDKMNVIALTQKKYLRQQTGSPYLVLVVVVLSIVVVAVILIEISHCK